MIIRAYALLLLALALPAAAQEDFDYEERQSEVRFVDATSDVNVRRDHVAGSPRVAILRRGERAQRIGTADGWVRVRTRKGKKGWVDRRYLTKPFPADTPEMAEEQYPPCPTDPSAPCPDIGCVKNQAEELRHKAKRNASRTGRITPLAISSFETLQTRARDAVGEDADLLADDRDLLRNLPVGDARVSEGSRVLVTGYVVGEPRPNKKETVNCNFTGELNNDYHIPIATRPSTGNHKLDEYRSIVVEMIPQDRPDGWTDEKLKKIRDAKLMVKVEGRLFYDDLHQVNKTPRRPVGGEPRRFSIWEVHPVTEFWVCKKKRCVAKNANEWITLGKWQPAP